MSEGGLAGTAFVDLEPRFGAGFAGALAGKLKTIAGPAAIVGIGAGLFAVGEKFDSLFNKIRVQTGATGGSFDSLRQSAKNVLAGTAGSFDQVSAAIGGLFQRTKLTGPALDELAKKQVTLARITKTDVGQNVESTTALFARYNVAAKDQSAELDVLFKASQQGGKGLATLVGEMQKGAPALTAFGFGIDKSAALIAGLERAGVNVAPVLTGLRTGFGKIAKEGGDPQKVLAGVFKELRDGKDPTKATADALKLFGARGGKELADAVRSGRFDIDALFKTITGGKGGILETGTAVSTIGGKFQRLKNIALVAIEPIATKLVDLANVALGKVVAGVTAAGPIVGHAFGFIRDRAGELVSAIGTRLAPTFDRIRTAATRVFKGAQDVIANFGAFVHGNAAGIGVAIGKMFGFQEDSSQTAGIIAFAQNARDALGSFLTKAREVGAGIGQALGRIDFGAIFGQVKSTLAGVFDAVKGIDFGTIFGRLKDIVAPILPPLLELGKAIGELAVKAFPVLVAAVGDVIAGAIRLRPVFVAIVAIGYVLARVAGVVIAVALKAAAVATGLLAHHAGILRPILVALVAGFVALKVVRGVQAGILGAARAAGTAYGTFARLAANARSTASALLTNGKNAIAAGRTYLTLAANIVKNVAAFVAQKAAAIASAVATKAMAAAQWLLNAAMDANPVVLIVAGIAALAAGIVLAYQHFGPFRAVVDAVGRALKTVAEVIVGAVAGAFNWVRSHWPLLLAILTGPFGIAALLITRNWHRITEGAATAFHAVTGFFKRLPGQILGLLTKAGELLLNVGKAIIRGLLRGVELAATGLFNFYIRLPLVILGLVAKAGDWLFGIGRKVIGGLLRGIRNIASHVWDFFTGLPGTILGYFGDAGTWLLDVGGKIIGGLLDGIKGGLGKVKDFVGGIAGKLVSWKGPPAKDAVLLVPIGGLIMGGLVHGIDRALPHLKAKLGDVTKTIAGGIHPKTTLELDANTKLPKLPHGGLPGLANVSAERFRGTVVRLLFGMVGALEKITKNTAAIATSAASSASSSSSSSSSTGTSTRAHHAASKADRIAALKYLHGLDVRVAAFLGHLGHKPSAAEHTAAIKRFVELDRKAADAHRKPPPAPALTRLETILKAAGHGFFPAAPKPHPKPTVHVVHTPLVDAKRFLGIFHPPPPPPPAGRVQRLAHDALNTIPGGTPHKPLHQENHFHGGELPTPVALDYAGRKLAFTLANTGRTP